MKIVLYLLVSLFIFCVNCDDYITGKNDQTIFDVGEEEKPISNVSEQDQTILDVNEQLNNLVESDCEVKINTSNSSFYVNCEDNDLSGIKVAIIDHCISC